jgi:membrane-bound hydrogenase subunit beta
MVPELLSPQQIVDRFTDTFKEGIKQATIKEWGEGVKKKKMSWIWIYLDRELLRSAVEEVAALDFPHLSVISGVDTGDAVDLIYHMSIYFTEREREIKLALVISLPKSDLTVPSIADIIPGAGYTEREKQDMLGITVINIPDGRRLFLPEDFPEGVYPWRKDETGIPDDMIKHLWAVGRPTDRPVPAVKPKEKKKPLKKAPTEEMPGEKPAAETAAPQEEGDIEPGTVPAQDVPSADSPAPEPEQDASALEEVKE